MPSPKRFLPLSSKSKQKNATNTSILMWGKRLFALNEGGMPAEIAPSDPATLGEQDLGMVVESFSAYPHEVPSRRRYNPPCLLFGLDTLNRSMHWTPEEAPT